ncbi:hypothetical protein KM043_005548 [Ampulex compressa]|nr:hypothetical protein KM043_005548 [Ampulex compressa]
MQIGSQYLSRPPHMRTVNIGRKGTAAAEVALELGEARKVSRVREFFSRAARRFRWILRTQYPAGALSSSCRRDIKNVIDREERGSPGLISDSLFLSVKDPFEHSCCVAGRSDNIILMSRQAVLLSQMCFK